MPPLARRRPAAGLRRAVPSRRSPQTARMEGTAGRHAYGAGSWSHRKLRGRGPAGAAADHRVEDGDELPHCRDGGHYRRLSTLQEALVEGAYRWIETACGEGSHLQDMTNWRATAPSRSFSNPLPTVIVQRSNSHQCREQRSEENTSELHSPRNSDCLLLLEKKQQHTRTR